MCWACTLVFDVDWTAQGVDVLFDETIVDGVLLLVVDVLGVVCA